MKLQSIAQARTVRIQGSEDDALPAALSTALRNSGVAAGWIRGVGQLADVVLRSLDASGNPVERRFTEPMQLVSLEGTALGSDSATSRLLAVLARAESSDSESASIVGVLVSARVVHFDAMLVELELTTGASATSGGSVESVPRAPASSSSVLGASNKGEAPAVSWGEAAAASKAARPAPSTTLAAANIPLRPVRRAVEEVEQAMPAAGDVVEHFAFGACEVIESDGERIHLRLSKDGRVKEIALQMLRVVPLDLESQPHRFRLERR